jgi:hypothetical protein
VLRQLPSWITHYNEVHPHKALRYRSPREFIALTKELDHAWSFRGYNTGNQVGEMGKQVGVDEGQPVMPIARALRVLENGSPPGAA